MDKTPNKSQLNYTGEKQPKLGERDTTTQRLLYPYLADGPLVEAVNLAIYLERPLLIQGEPGCGKTRLARAVAYELGLPYEAWHIKSISRAQDGLYTYDTVGRLRDAQLAAVNRLPKEEENTEYVGDPYVHLGPLGRAFHNTQRTVVLIDEIDKADIDFPNDLLLELDEKRFKVKELALELDVCAHHSPIVFITSNDEKDLPEAFLRRCLFQYIQFPTNERLKEIVNAHFPNTPLDLATKAIECFQELREDMRTDKGETGKKLSTSELIDWIRVLLRNPPDEVLAMLEGRLPYLSVLLKNWDSYRRYLEQISKNTSYDHE